MFSSARPGRYRASENDLLCSSPQRSARAALQVLWPHYLVTLSVSIELTRSQPQKAQHAIEYITQHICLPQHKVWNEWMNDVLLRITLESKTDVHMGCIGELTLLRSFQELVTKQIGTERHTWVLTEGCLKTTSRTAQRKQVSIAKFRLHRLSYTTTFFLTAIFLLPGFLLWLSSGSWSSLLWWALRWWIWNKFAFLFTYVYCIDCTVNKHTMCSPTLFFK